MLGSEIGYVLCKKPMPEAESPPADLNTGHPIGFAREVLRALRSDISGTSERDRKLQEEESKLQEEEKTHEILVNRISSLNSNTRLST